MDATQDVDTILDVWTNQNAGRIFPGSIPGSEPIRFPFPTRSGSPFEPEAVPLSTRSGAHQSTKTWSQRT